MKLTDKQVEILAALAGALILLGLVYIDPAQMPIVVPLIIALIGGLSAAEAGRRRGKRKDYSGGTGEDTNEAYHERARVFETSDKDPRDDDPNRRK